MVEVEKEWASKGVSGAALGTGIAGLSLGVLNALGGLGGVALGMQRNNCGCNNCGCNNCGCANRCDGDCDRGRICDRCGCRDCDEHHHHEHREREER